MNDFNNLLLSKTDLNATQDFLNRRVFCNGAAALSATALAGLLPQRSPDREVVSRISRQSQAGDLSLPVGGSFPNGLVRSQAGNEEHHGKDLPDSIRKGQRLTTMTSGQKNFPIAPSIFKSPGMESRANG